MEIESRKIGRRRILDRISVALGHFTIVLVGGSVVAVYIIDGLEAGSVLTPAIPLLIVAGFVAIGLILNGKR